MIGKQTYETKKDIEKLKKEIKEYEETIGLGEYSPIIEQYFDDCHEGDKKLQKIVSEKISNDLISFLILPFHELDDFNEFNFILAAKDGRQVRVKENKLYRKYAHECFDNIIPLEPRIIAFEEKNQNLYI